MIEASTLHSPSGGAIGLPQGVNYRIASFGFGLALLLHVFLLWKASLLVFTAAPPSRPIRITLLAPDSAAPGGARAIESNQPAREVPMPAPQSAEIPKPKTKPAVSKSRVEKKVSKPRSSTVTSLAPVPAAPNQDADLIEAAARSTQTTESNSVSTATGGRANRASSNGGDLRVICEHCPKPIYPRIARLRGWEGVVDLKVVLNPDGSVASAKVSQSSNHSALDEAALTVARESRFRMPAEVSAAMEGRIAYAFRLTD